jgi:hypothetical protein
MVVSSGKFREHWPASSKLKARRERERERERETHTDLPQKDNTVRSQSYFISRRKETGLHILIHVIVAGLDCLCGTRASSGLRLKTCCDKDVKRRSSHLVTGFMFTP